VSRLHFSFKETPNPQKTKAHYFLRIGLASNETPWSFSPIPCGWLNISETQQNIKQILCQRARFLLSFITNRHYKITSIFVDLEIWDIERKIAYFYVHFRNGDPWTKRQRFGVLNARLTGTQYPPFRPRKASLGQSRSFLEMTSYLPMHETSKVKT
jgi:hypothetical protein